ncbi:winged helix-turn-helix domain-containing protein [Yokenella regensburgei]|jgi:DNA-binding winged helix-turn-helix (wHTH) protein|uniref:winged helix-turn-helix domain-containing protein n=1 Tax=Yokenella regensburgei TaxID=158877 RepID=UPI002076E3FF|nr:winged helix-turn-helix domain-containing protein [Yokenella regensburgei]
MRYIINASLIYDASNGSLSLPGGHEAETQLSVTANALLQFFLQHHDVVSREEVLKKVWDDNGLTSSNANLNQYLSMLRKTFRQYDIENIIITISRGNLQLNPQLQIETLDEPFTGTSETPKTDIDTERIEPAAPPRPAMRHRGRCWYLASAALLGIAALLLSFTLAGKKPLRPLSLTPMTHSQCELLASEDMLSSVAASTYGSNFDAVRQRLSLNCKPGERFVFFYGDKLQTNGLGRVFLAHCAVHEDNAFSYCDNYFYYSWKPQ